MYVRKVSLSTGMAVKTRIAKWAYILKAVFEKLNVF
jgi:hypothetical protein